MQIMYIYIYIYISFLLPVFSRSSLIVHLFLCLLCSEIILFISVVLAQLFLYQAFI